MKNTVARVLKIMSIVLFALCFLGAIFNSNKEEYKYDEGYSYDYEYDYDFDYGYHTVTKFDAGAFAGTMFVATVACSLIYAFGELLDLVSENNALLRRNHPNSQKNTSLPNEVEKNVVEEIATTEDGTNEEAHQEPSAIVQEEGVMLPLPYALKEVSARIYELVKADAFKTLGMVFDGSNDAIETFYFKAMNPQTKVETKMTIALLNKDDKTYLSFEPRIDDKSKSMIEQVIVDHWEVK